MGAARPDVLGRQLDAARQQVAELAELAQCLGEPGAEAVDVGAAEGGGNEVDVALGDDLGGVSRGRLVGEPGDGPVHLLVLALEMADEWFDRDPLGAVELVEQVRGQPVLVVPLLVVLGHPLVDEAQAHAGAEDRLGAQRALDPRDGELRRVEVPGVGPEADGGAGVALSDRAHHPELRGLVAAGEAHVVLAPVALDPDLQALRQGVDHRYADAVEAAGKAVVALGELGAGVQAGEDHLDPPDLLAGVLVHRHAAAVVGDRHRAVLVEGDGDLGAVAGDGLVRGVVDHLLGQVVRAVGEGVHAGAPAHRLEPGEDFDGGGVVGAGHLGIGLAARP